MLIHRWTTPALRLRDDRGFTLMELLVSMLTATVVVGALFSILLISTSQTTLVADKVQANQLGRTAMTRIIDELHSSCLSPGFAPIQEKSNENELIFKNAYSEEATIPNTKAAEEKSKSGTGVFEHQIVWNSTAKTLTDFIYKSTSGEGPEAVLPTPDYSATTHEAANAEPKKGVLLASNVTQTEESGGAKIPIFKYYRYYKESISSSSTPDGTLAEITSTYLPLKKETEAGSEKEKINSAENTSSVLVSFRVAPVDGKVEHDQYIDLSNQVTLAFSAPNTENPIKYSACE
jgi:type II secretory pathway pseudopilin PulG